MSRSRGRMVLAVVFGLLSLSAWYQAVIAAFGRSGDPPMLIALQTLTGAAAAAAAWSSWSGARWAPTAALLYGVIAGGMIAGLGPMLDMAAEERGGLWAGAAVILAFALFSAWLLRRSLRREGAQEMTAP